MDTRTGEVAPLQYFTDKFSAGEVERFVKSIDPADLSKVRRQELIKFGHTKVLPRSRCPCGSGHRFKRCCMFKG